MSDYPKSPKRVRYGGPEFESTLLNWFDETADKTTDDDNVNVDYFEVSEHDSVSEAEAHSEDENERIEEMQSDNEKSSAESIEEMQTDNGVINQQINNLLWRKSLRMVFKNFHI
ncbi:hypothetical protein QE152_g29205 [Popillia japonica]|uniref:Uncharacterized protein n=1 Tax=Popillia japonica TaxID=7064 RepID=A0AAW1JJS1_POPJA